jgi:hypothetical protein
MRRPVNGGCQGGNKTPKRGFDRVKDHSVVQTEVGMMFEHAHE